MPFVLTNAPTTFQELINNIIFPCVSKNPSWYFLMTSLFTDKMRMNIVDTRELFCPFCKLTISKQKKMLKCIFFSTQVEYFVHIISGSGVTTDPTKISDMFSWKSPSTITHLRGFLGPTGYDGRYVEGYATIYKPLHEVLKKKSFT
jgi:hypothetical protein